MCADQWDSSDLRRVVEGNDMAGQRPITQVGNDLSLTHVPDSKESHSTWGQVIALIVFVVSVVVAGLYAYLDHAKDLAAVLSSITSGVSAAFGLLGILGDRFAKRPPRWVGRLVSWWVVLLLALGSLAPLAYLFFTYGLPTLCDRLTDAAAQGAGVESVLNGECIGFTVTKNVTFAAVGTQLATEASNLLAGNPPPTTQWPNTLTVLWLGTLNCEPVDATSPDCANPGNPYLQAETDTMQGLQWAREELAKKHWYLRVVLINGGQGMKFAKNAVDDLLDRTDLTSSWTHVVAVDGSDSRDSTKEAIKDLLHHGVPLVSDTLTADDGKGTGLPFLTDPGYIQMSPSAKDSVSDALTYLDSLRNTLHLNGVVYDWDPADDGGETDENDLYVTSMRDDLRALGQGRYTVRPVTSLDDQQICQDATQPAVVFFGARWLTAQSFVDQIQHVCEQHGKAPALVIADSSMNRILDSDDARMHWMNVDWPIVYYGSGWQCSDITRRANVGVDSANALQVLLKDPKSLESSTSQNNAPCAAGTTGNVGNHVSIAWDEVMMAYNLAGLGPIGKDDRIYDFSNVNGTYIPVNEPGNEASPVVVSQGTVTSQRSTMTIRECTHARSGGRNEIGNGHTCS
jgi:hypothetical protein